MPETRRIFSNHWPAAAIPVALAILLLGGCGHAVGDGSGGPFSTLVNIYRGPLNRLSAVRHGTCPMHPTCSEYARQAVAKHGEAIGWIMASDRLMRCGRDELRLSPMVRTDRGLRTADPVERNDFWRVGPRPEPPALSAVEPDSAPPE